MEQPGKDDRRAAYCSTLPPEEHTAEMKRRIGEADIFFGVWADPSEARGFGLSIKPGELQTATPDVLGLRGSNEENTGLGFDGCRIGAGIPFSP
jgi:hypothetical protein